MLTPGFILWLAIWIPIWFLAGVAYGRRIGERRRLAAAAAPELIAGEDEGDGYDPSAHPYREPARLPAAPRVKSPAELAAEATAQAQVDQRAEAEARAENAYKKSRSDISNAVRGGSYCTIVSLRDMEADTLLPVARKHLLTLVMERLVADEFEVEMNENFLTVKWGVWEKKVKELKSVIEQYKTPVARKS